MKRNVVVRLKAEERAKVVEAIQRFRGQATVLESALGALIVGQHYGWRVLKIVHGNQTYNKYQDILGLKFQDVCPPDTELSRKSVGFKVAGQLKAFWAVVRGDTKVEDKGVLS